MDQIALYSIEKIIENRPYRISLPFGATWEESVQVAQEFVDKIKDLKIDSEEKNKKTEQPESQPDSQGTQTEVAS